MKSTNYLPSILKQFEYYKMLGDRTFAQLTDEHLFWKPDPEANSIGVLVNHLSGNMKSRWTDFLTSDGEKPWRDRDGEFEDRLKDRKAVETAWESGWECLFGAIRPLTDEDLAQTIYIRNMGHTVTEAINRQLAHYAYHIGQIVFLGRQLKGPSWQSLSIPKGGSKTYNAKTFAKGKRQEHFTDEFLKDEE
ncbi:MAG: DUF1572 domain-containing protein [Bacteroidota bacterium]